MPFSLLFGKVVEALSPARTIHLVLSRLTGGSPSKGILDYPAKLGYWPAALGAFAFVWQELVNPDSAYLNPIRLWLAIYFAIMIVGASVFGDTWFKRADPFEVYSSLLARLSVWGRRDGRLVWRTPLANLEGTIPRPGLVVVVAVLFGSTAFDSYKDTLTWVNFVDGIDLSKTLLDTIALVGVLRRGGGAVLAGRDEHGRGDEPGPRRYAGPPYRRCSRTR